MTSSQLLLNFTVNQFNGEYISILSVFKDKLLVGSYGFPQLFICSRDGQEGHDFSNVSLIRSEEPFDATWTQRGNIVYMKWNKVVIMSAETGEVITTHTQIANPQFLSVSNDGIIYCADMKTGVYQSTDDGVSWSLVFSSTYEWQCTQVIKVTTDHIDDFWTVEESSSSYHLRVYSMNRKRSDGNVTWKDINFPTIDGKGINLSWHSKLFHDGGSHIFLSDKYNKAVHVLSVNGQYLRQIVYCMNEPTSLTLDMTHQLLYVGQLESVVEVFKLTYGDRGD